MRPSFAVQCAAAVAALFALRLFASAVLPLSADEAYYWLWSRHLAAGYFDHPPAVAWMIAAGTAVFGKTALGVRVVAVLSSLLATMALWRAAGLVYGEKAGPLAALFFNLTLTAATVGMAATPDAPAMLAATAFFWALAEWTRSRNGVWWLVAGAAAGLGLLSKYTGFFLGAGALLWLLAVPNLRREFRSPWPWAGAALALLLFSPNLFWNAGHGWQTFAFQFGRVGEGGLSWRYLPELIGAQAMLASPFLLVLMGFGMAAKPADPKRFLAPALIWPALVYFCVHALHARVQGNWPCVLYPMAAAAAAGVFLSEGKSRLKAWSARLAAPTALALLAAAYVQTLFGVVPMGRKDPAARLLAVGMPKVAAHLATLKTANGAAAILTTDYATAAWMNFYLPAGTVVADIGEEYRWPAGAPLAAGTKPLLYVCEERSGKRNLDKSKDVAADFASVAPIARIDRTRDGSAVRIAQYRVYLVSGAKRATLGRVP